MASSDASDASLHKQVSHYDTELRAASGIRISIELVSSAQRHLNFLRIISGLPYLHKGGAFICQAIRRYQSFWMPLAAKHEATAECKLLPPLDVEWVWICHCLNPKAYQEFCKLHYSKIIDMPFFSDISAEAAARDKCKSLWSKSYPNEPFDLDLSKHQQHSENHTMHGCQILLPSHTEENTLIDAIGRQMSFYNQVSQPYMFDDKFMRISKERYRCFLYMAHKSQGKHTYIPTSDIQLMWQSHKVSPLAYAQDTEACLLEDFELLSWRQLSEQLPHAFENTAQTWEILFGHPYERAGAICQQVNTIGTVTPLETLSETIPATINWHRQDMDVNSKHEPLIPRYVLEACIQIRNTEDVHMLKEKEIFVRLRPIQACKALKVDIPLQKYKQDTLWHKISLMQCEVSSKGLVLELRLRPTECLGLMCYSKLLGKTTLIWSDLERESLLAIDTSFHLKKHTDMCDAWMIGASITPPVPAPYLLRSLPDRVTDDAGAMISKKIYRANKNQPQEGRWMSRTVLNHCGKECFVIRTRVASGKWKRKCERPIGVDWNDRVIHVHLGGWNYVVGSVGIASSKIIATATPFADELEQYKMKWSFSTGEALTVQMPIENLEWERHLRFSVKGSHGGVVRLLNGRHMQYQVPSAVPEEEEGFVTLVRYTAESRQGIATALFNWKLSAMEVLPEEDAVFVMLICTATQRTVADLGGKTVVSNFYSRKRQQKEAGKRDWGAVAMGEGSDVPSELMFWHLNPEEVLGMEISEEDFEGVLPKGASDHMYRGTSWLYAGGSSGLYKMSSKGSWDSVEHLFRFGSLPRFGSQPKVSATNLSR